MRDALGRVYILSNNHVLANSNGATIGDPEYQPGPYDGGTSADQIATLSDFQVINFTGGSNTIDAAIALSTTSLLDNATPADEGYGMPNATIYGDADGDGLFDNRDALLGLNVQKYGRTTRLTHGQITGVNATVSVCYEVIEFTCVKIARYTDQLIISPPGFSNGGDSGSLIVTDDGNLNPVALLFAGSPSVTIGNRIDLVLNRFGVAIDGFAPPPPGPLTDVAVTGVSGPSTAVQGHTASVTVTVKNFGNQDVASAFTVTLSDTTDRVTVGTQSVAGLAVGAGVNLTFAWTPTSSGDHILVGRHTLADDKTSNDQRSATIPVEVPLTDVAVTSFSTPGDGVIVGHTVNIGVTVTNAGNLDAGSFVVTLQDSTAGATIGTQTVTALAAGADKLVIFSWNATGAALGDHTLIATHDLSDDDAENNRLTTVVTVKPKPTDIAVTAITGPRSVLQGDTAHVVVTVQNVGEVDVTAPFAVALTDGTAGGVTVGTATVPGLAIGATTTVAIPWNTAGAALNGHILIATQKLPDAVVNNNAIAIAINVNAPPPPPPPPVTNDIAVTTVTTPGSVTQGSVATIGVTVQNVGSQNVSGSFDIVLTDQTAGVTIGTQTVAGLAAAANATRSFTWNTTSATQGGHTLVATQTWSDENAANNTKSVTVTIAPQPVDLAVTGITAPARVNQGDIAPVAVTVQNVGGQEVTGSFDIVLTDGYNGPTIGTQTVTGLAVGASVTRTLNWNTAGAALNGHTLFATQKLADNNSVNNTIGIGVIVNAPPTTDVAVSSVTAPATATQGTTVAVVVGIQNVGGLSVGTNFDLVLTDATAGVTVGTQTIAGLAAGSNTSRTFNWNTTAAALGGHNLVATHTLTDANGTNNQASATITVNAPTTDVAVTSLTAPGTVNTGSTATIGVTVQNVGGVTVGATFNVVLTDATAGVTIGTQTVAGLAVGALSTLSFNWNTTSAALGGHTLVATQSLTDDNATNNTRSTVVTVNPQPVDLAVTGITAPARVTQGDIAPVVVTVQNVAGPDVTTNFDVVLTDGYAGVTIGTQTIAGLAAGASVTRTFNWNTAGAALNGHTLFATQKLADNNSANNTIGIGVIVNAPPTTDVAVSGVTAPATVTQGTTAAIGVTVQNVGGVNVSTSFDVVLTDATAGVTIGTQAVTGLAIGASATRTFNWNATVAALGGHTLVATHTLSDANAANNQGSAAITVIAPITDVAVSGMTAPGAVVYGSTAAIGVTVQNVGGLSVGTTFNVVLTDATAGVTIGSQTVTGLAVGATATRTFNWATTGAALGGHTLVATQGLTDDNAANNTRSAVVTVNTAPADLAVANLTAPSRVTQGDTAPVVVTVQNVGGQDVTANFDVVLTDGGTGGVTLGTQTISGLAAGASATRTFSWNTAGVATNGHILTATQKLADVNSSNNARAIVVSVDPPSVHVGNLDGVADTSGNTGTWSATVRITAHDWRHNALNGVTVTGTWNGSGPVGQCVTADAGGTGTCAVVLSSIPNATRQVSFAVTAMALSGYVYKSSANHDPDASSNGFSVTVKRQ